MPKNIIIIPTFNEVRNIELLIREIFALPVKDLGVIVVDDNSPDGTAFLVEKLKQEFKNLYLIKRNGKFGLGSAYVAGFKKALFIGAEYIFEMDADFSHNPQDIPRLLELAGEADLVIGSRKIKGGSVVGWNFRRKLMSGGAILISRLILRLKPKDVTAGFRCFQRKVLEKIDLDKIKSNGYAFQEELLYKTQKMGFKIVEVPVVFVDRKFGKSKLGLKEIVEFFMVIFKLRFKL